MFSLIILLPVAVLVLAALGIVILQQTRPSIGYSWLVASLAGLVVTGIMLFLRLRLPSELVASAWRPFGELSSPPAFLLDGSSWPYAFCLVVLALAFMLTDAARLETEARPYNWAAGLGLTAVGLLAVMAGNPMTLVVVWTAVDIIELLMVLSTEAGRRLGQQTVTVFSVRSSGTLLVILAMLFARSRGIDFNLNPIPGELAIFMLLAAGLRLGVLPLNLPYTREVYTWRGLGNMMRMIGPASSLVVLARMPAQVATLEWRALLLGLSAMAALYGGAMWLAANHELNGRPYWSIAFAGLAISSVINGGAQASVAWGVALLLCGSVLFFYSAYRRRNLVIPFLAMVGVTGLPFTPAAAGWEGLVGGEFNLYTLVYLLAVVLLIWGGIRHALRPRVELHRLERWVHPVYPAGLLALILAQWVIGLFGWHGSRTVGVWWASTAVLVIAGAGIVAAFSLRKAIPTSTNTNNWLGIVARRIGMGVGAFFRLNWLYGFFAGVYHVIQAVVQLVTTVFEGDGGILWSLVMLAILVSLIWMGGKF
jgi:hypothetical protein